MKSSFYQQIRHISSFSTTRIMQVHSTANIGDFIYDYPLLLAGSCTRQEVFVLYKKIAHINKTLPEEHIQILKHCQYVSHAHFLHLL